jgi:hypothetical protein
MELMQINPVEKKDRKQQMLGQGQNAMQGISIGKGIGSLFAGGATKGALTYGGTTGAGTKAGSYGLNAASSYVPYEGPEYLAYTGEEVPAAAGQTAETAAGSEGFWATQAGPIGIGTAGMAFGAKAEGDYIKGRDSAGNAPYSSKGRPSLNADYSLSGSYKGKGLSLQDTNPYSYDAISRRMNAKKDLDPTKIMDVRKSLIDLDLPDADKASISKKLTEAFNLSKLIKIG